MRSRRDRVISGVAAILESHRVRWQRTSSTLAASLAAAFTLAAALVPEDPWAVLLFGPSGPTVLERALVATVGLGLLVASWGLVRGKRRAASAVALLMCFLALLGILDRADLLGAVAAVVLAALLYLSRGAFARGGGGGRAATSGALAVLAALLAYGLYAGALLAGGVDAGRALGAAAIGLVRGDWGIGTDRWLALALDGLLLTAAGAGGRWLYGLLRPAVASDGHSHAEHGRAAALVAEHAADSLDPFSLREDKSFHFTADGVLAYRTLRETAVASGDPIGPEGCAAEVVASFRRLATERGWDLVLTGVSERNLDAYRSLGLRVTRIGEEAVVDPRGFSLEGRAIRKVRQSVARVEREGWSVELVEGCALTPALADEIAAVEATWREAQPRLHGFSMTLGRLWGAPEDVRSLYVLGRDPSGALGSFLRFVEYGRGLSLDVMRRAPGASPNGLNEALVVAALLRARELGLEEVSLNFAGFAHVMAANAALGRRQRMLRFLLTRVHGRFQLERLVSFNDKFGPTWRPRYLVYDAPIHLPVAAIRVLQAEAYLRQPRPSWLSARWRPLRDPVVEDALTA